MVNDQINQIVVEFPIKPIACQTLYTSFYHWLVLTRTYHLYLHIKGCNMCGSLFVHSYYYDTDHTSQHCNQHEHVIISCQTDSKLQSVDFIVTHLVFSRDIQSKFITYFTFLWTGLDLCFVSLGINLSFYFNFYSR